MSDFSHIDERWQMSATGAHVYFLGGPFSQWFPSPFSAEVPHASQIGFQRFNCAEQFMMAGKAALFGDEETLAAILKSKVPAEQKRLGRQVRGFDEAAWKAAAKAVVQAGTLAKFSQNADLGAFLLATGDKTLVEGASGDPVWGVKLAWNDTAILDEANWQGANWLGECLMATRDTLRAQVRARIEREEDERRR